MRRIALDALRAALLAAVAEGAFGAPAALAADTRASQKVTSQARLVKVRPRVPEFPADVKALGDRLLATASPAVRSWSNQNAHAIAKGSGEPEALASRRAAGPPAQSSSSWTRRSSSRRVSRSWPSCTA